MSYVVADRSRWALPLLIDRAADRFGDAPYLSFALDDRELTYAEATTAARAFAGGLGSAGVAAGDRVLLMLRNRAEFVLGWLGAATLGAVQVPVNVDYRGSFLEHVATTTDAEVILVEDDLLDAVEASLPNLRTLRTVVVVGEARPLPGVRVLPFAELMSAAPRAPVAARPSDPCAVHFTSGTSGRSKGARIPNAAMHVLCERNRELLAIDRDSTYLTELPLFHINAQMSVYAGLLVGCRVRIERRFSAGSWLERVRASGATHTSLLGVMLGFVLAQPRREDEADHQLRAVWTVPYTVEAARAFGARFGVERVVTSYGSTEIGMLARRGSAADGVEGSAGRVDGALYDVAVVDETGGAVAPGEVGELLVRPRLPWIVTDGYVGMAEETTAAFRDLWFHTGDCVRIDETGSLWFVDRLAERIRRRGENVASAEVERVLLEHPGIADAAVVAVPADDAGGEDEIKAVLVADGEGVDAAAVWSWCDERLPYFAVPRYVEFVPVLPKTATAKVQKTELRAAGVTSATADRGPAPSRRGRR